MATCRNWLVDVKTIAKNVKTTGLPLVHQLKDCGASSWQCPQCCFRIDNSNVPMEWPGLPIGVKFEPSDVELLEHLAAKCGAGNKKPHPYIDDFIPTLDVHEGICSQHPEKLPGARKDGSSVHFFYRTTNAYARGQRKRRKICNGTSLRTDVRWHKTGKTKPILKNGVQIGYKKIMVLYRTADGSSKPCKINWVMHQYHLGPDEDEKDGEYVVAKIFYQARKQAAIASISDIVVEEASDEGMKITNPTTPKTDPPQLVKSSPYEDAVDDYVIEQELKQVHFEISTPGIKDDVKKIACEDDSKAIDDFDAFYTSFFSQDNLDVANSFLETTDIANLDLSSTHLAELYFSSEDSILGGLDFL